MTGSFSQIPGFFLKKKKKSTSQSFRAGTVFKNIYKTFSNAFHQWTYVPRATQLANESLELAVFGIDLAEAEDPVFGKLRLFMRLHLLLQQLPQLLLLEFQLLLLLLLLLLLSGRPAGDQCSNLGEI
jgi:hypothetical protein